MKRTTYYTTAEPEPVPQRSAVQEVYYGPATDGHTQANTDDEWTSIQKKIDVEYEKKLKEVSDEAMTKLRDYQQEHKHLIEKTQFLYENSMVQPQYEVVEPPRHHVVETTEYRTPGEPEMVTTAVHEDGFNDAYHVRVLRQDFQDVINHKLNMDGEVYLVDILEALNLLDLNIVQDDYLYSFIKQSKDNLVIKSEKMNWVESEDIQQNLFKVCCAILNHKVQQRGHNFLDDKLLYTYLDGVNLEKIDKDVLMIDQVSAIKSIINRKCFSLTDFQCKMISEKFVNMSHCRKLQQRAQHYTTHTYVQPVPAQTTYVTRLVDGVERRVEVTPDGHE